MISCLRNVLGSGEFSRPTFKQELTDPQAMLGGSALNAVTGFVSNLLTNNTNKKLTRETNAQNYQIFKESMKYNERMQDKQNAYNSAAAQVDRYRAAGINPYLAMYGNGGNAGVQNAAVTAPDAPQMQAPHVNNPYPEQQINNIFQNQLLSQQIRGEGLKNDALEIDNTYRRANAAADLQKKWSELRKIGVEISQAEENLAFQIMVQPTQYGREIATTKGAIASFKEIEERVLNVIADTALKRTTEQATQRISKAQQLYYRAAAHQAYKEAALAVQKGEESKAVIRGIIQENISKALHNVYDFLSLKDRLKLIEKTTDQAVKDFDNYYLRLFLGPVSNIGGAVAAGAIVRGKPQPGQLTGKTTTSSQFKDGQWRDNITHESYEYSK